MWIKNWGQLVMMNQTQCAPAGLVREITLWGMDQVKLEWESEDLGSIMDLERELGLSRCRCALRMIFQAEWAKWEKAIGAGYLCSVLKAGCELSLWEELICHLRMEQADIRLEKQVGLIVDDIDVEVINLLLIGREKPSHWEFSLTNS